MNKTMQILMPEVGLTKAYIANTSQGIVDLVKEGELNPLDTKLKLKAVAEMTKQAIDAIDEMATIEAMTYGSNKFEHHGVMVEVAEVGTAYNYFCCGDPVYHEMQVRLSALKLEIKNRESFLKTIKTSMNIITDDGEGVKITAPIKTSKSSTKITFK